MSDSNKIKLTVLPTETMHADLTWLLINPANMATKDQPVKQKDWVEVPTCGASKMMSSDCHSPGFLDTFTSGGHSP